MSHPPDPRFAVIVGDVHGNLPWMLHVLDEADKLFTQSGESRRIVIQLGDFGFRPTTDSADLITMNALLGIYGMELWFIDGNHDWHPDLQEIAAAYEFEVTCQIDSGYPPVPVPVPGFRNIRYLPRGTRWTWAGRTWLAVGGAASVDRLLRTAGVDWWPEEEVTPEQARAVQAAGPADVLLSHDCPADYIPWDKMMTRDQIPPAWIPELPRAAAHASRLNGIARSVGVTRVFHGHYHVTRDDFYRMPEPGSRDVRVTGLDMGGVPGNYQLIDVEAVCGETR